MSYRSKIASQMRSEFSYSELENQFRRFALSSLANLLGQNPELEFSPYKAEDGNTFLYLFADMLDDSSEVRNAGNELSRVFNMIEPPDWNSNQLTQIEAAIGYERRLTFKLAETKPIIFDWLFRYRFIRVPALFIWHYMKIFFNRIFPKRETEASTQNERIILPFEIAEIRDAIAQKVLLDASLQIQVSRAFYAHLQDKVIMHPDGGETPHLAVGTYWILLHSFMDLIFKGMDDKQFNPVKEGLSNMVRYYSEELYGWASFWDQYVFHLLRLRGVMLPEPIEKSAKLLDSLVSGSRTRISKNDPTMKNWEKQAPGYAKYLVASGNTF